MSRPFKASFREEDIDVICRHATGEKLTIIGEGQTSEVLEGEHVFISTLISAENLLYTHSKCASPPNYQLTKTVDSHWTITPNEPLHLLASAWREIDKAIKSFSNPPETSNRLGIRLGVFYHTYKPFMEEYLGVVLSPKPLHVDKIDDFENALKRGFDDHRHALKCQQTSRIIEQQKINTRRNLRSLTNYVDALFDTHASLYVVHLDLGYHVANATYTRLREDLRTLFYARHRNPLWKDDLVGHIWKIEDAPQRRCHAHLLLFYKGSTAEQHREDVTHLQNRWIREITHQEGACFARLNRKGEVPVWVPENTGYLIEKEDTEALDELRSYLHYLIKVDQLFGLEAGPKSYVFAKGNAPRTSTKS